jgi:HD superfamily phosphohydrolase
MTLSHRDGSEKVVVDSIQGDIHLRAREVQVIDTASFQRLRKLKQLAMAQMVYPTATITRFAHSIGALGTMIRILQVAKENGVEFDEELEDNLRLAALLHDVGHYPYSHLMEKIDKVILTEEETENASINVKAIDVKKSKYPSHEEVGRLIVTNQPDLIEAIGDEERAKAVADIFTRSGTADPQLSKLIHSSFDIDRWDYLLRDSHATGVPYGKIDINYLLNNLRVSKDKILGFEEKSLAALEHFLLARFFMHRVVYYHKTTFGLEESCRQLLRRLRDKGGGKYAVPSDGEAIKATVQSPEKLSKFTDAFVDEIVSKATTDENEVIRALALSIQNRRPPALLKEVSVCEEMESQYHAGKTFRQNCRAKLYGLADEFKIPLGQFLLCEPSVAVIKVPQEKTYGQVAKLTAEDIRKKAHEEEEEDIKVFKGDEDEPTSLMDIDYSLVAKYAKYSLQLFRLYVVYEGENRDGVIAQLRDKVKDWDRA